MRSADKIRVDLSRTSRFVGREGEGYLVKRLVVTGMFMYNG